MNAYFNYEIIGESQKMFTVGNLSLNNICSTHCRALKFTNYEEDVEFSNF